LFFHLQSPATMWKAAISLIIIIIGLCGAFKPPFDVEVTIHEAQIGDLLEIECNKTFAGKHISIYWFEYDESTRTSKQLAANQSTLRFDHVDSSAHGLYFCLIQYENGLEEEHYHKLLIASSVKVKGVFQCKSGTKVISTQVAQESDFEQDAIAKAPELAQCKLTSKQIISTSPQLIRPKPTLFDHFSESLSYLNSSMQQMAERFSSLVDRIESNSRNLSLNSQDVTKIKSTYSQDMSEIKKKLDSLESFKSGTADILKNLTNSFNGMINERLFNESLKRLNSSIQNEMEDRYTSLSNRIESISPQNIDSFKSNFDKLNNNLTMAFNGFIWAYLFDQPNYEGNWAWFYYRQASDQGACKSLSGIVPIVPRSILFNSGVCVELFTENNCKGTRYIATGSCCSNSSLASSDKLFYDVEANGYRSAYIRDMKAVKSGRPCMV